jgi:hypothetical protein
LITYNQLANARCHAPKKSAKPKEHGVIRIRIRNPQSAHTAEAFYLQIDEQKKSFPIEDILRDHFINDSILEPAMFEANQMQMDTEPTLNNEMEEDLMALADDEWLALTENEPEESPSVITPSIEHIMTGTRQCFALLLHDSSFKMKHHWLL